MKTKYRIIAYIIALLCSREVSAQCVDQLIDITYDTTVTGSGNGFYTFTVPKFNAPTGTLVEVKIRSEVTLSYNFQLENKESFTINNYRVRVAREQEISSDAMMTPLTNSFQRTYGSYTLTAADGVAGSGTDFISNGPLYVMNQNPIENTLYNTAEFLGQGTVSFDYSALTYSIVFGSVNYNYNGTAEDTLHFSVTYRYCPTWFLGADIFSFTAVKKENDLVDIQWITLNEKTNRKYELQLSTDGRRFVGVAQFAAKAVAETGTYRYQHRFEPGAAGKQIFRLKQIEQDGTVKYSPVRVVEIGNANKVHLRLYPNPATGPTTLLFDNSKRGNWNVELYSLSGQLLKRYQFSNALMARINTNHELSRGMYMVKIVNRDSHEIFVERLTVQ